MLLRHAVGVCGLCLELAALPSTAEPSPGLPEERKPSDVLLPVDAATLHRQYTALSSMPLVRVAYTALGPVWLVEGSTGIALSSQARNLKAGQSAPEILQKFSDVLLATGSETLEIGYTGSVGGRMWVIHTNQFINGVRVLGGGVSVRIDEATGLVDLLTARFLPDRGLPREPKISETEAAQRAVQSLKDRNEAKPGSVKTFTPTLAYYGALPGSSTSGSLVWVVPVRYVRLSDGGTEDLQLWIDAVSGEHLETAIGPKSAALSVYTANNAAPNHTSFPTGLTWLFDSPGASTDPIVMTAYNNLLDSLRAVAPPNTIGYTPTVPLRLAIHYGSNVNGAWADRIGGADYIWIATARQARTAPDPMARAPSRSEAPAASPYELRQRRAE